MKGHKNIATAAVSRSGSRSRIQIRLNSFKHITRHIIPQKTRQLYVMFKIHWSGYG